MHHKIFFLLFAILIAGGIFVFMTNSNQEPNENETMQEPEAAKEKKVEGDFLTINGNRLKLEIMRTREEQIRGLSGRESLDENTGILFVYEQPAIPSFWMKEMNFSIDIIWIGEDRKIADITENLAPETYPQTFSPKVPVRYVLEVNAGWKKEHDISVGDEVLADGIF